MGWKSSIEIKKSEAIVLIMKAMTSENTPLEDIGHALECFYGDNPDLEYHGFNFLIEDE